MPSFQLCRITGKKRQTQGPNEGGKGDTLPRVPIRYGGAESLRVRRITAGAAEKSQKCQKYFFLSTLNLLSKKLRFHHGGVELRPWGRRFDRRGAKLVFCPGRHLISLRPWSNLMPFGSLHFRNNWE